MARLPRLYMEGCSQHVIQRGNNREACFYHEEDYDAYLSFLGDAARKYRVAVHAYVLMTNHVHLLVTASDEKGLGLMMQSLGRKYVRYFNFRYGRSGTLWEGRYKAALVDTEHYLLTVYRYIELNPVRANMIRRISDYPWSSYRCNALGVLDPLITPHPIYSQLDKSDKKRQLAYRMLFRGRIAEQDLSAIRHATNKAWVLGDERFKAQVEARTGRRSTPLPRGGDRKSAAFRGAYNQRL